MALRLLLAALVLCACGGARAQEEAYVTCGSAVKLKHVSTSYYLHSHEVAYGSGSGQQSVTAFPASDDAGSLWTLRATADGACRQGDKIALGSSLRLFHGPTGKWLHSHNHRSPLTQQQEVRVPSPGPLSACGLTTWRDTGERLRLRSAERQGRRLARGEQVWRRVVGT